MYWRAPAVGVGLALFYGLWVIVDCRTGGHCGSMYKMSVSTLKQYDQLQAVVKQTARTARRKRTGSMAPITCSWDRTAD